MRRFLAFLLCVILLLGAVSCAWAQTVSCPEAHLVLTVPDSWKVLPLLGTDDPELRLLLDGKDLSLSVYVAENGGLAPDAFALFTGDETESGTVRLDGVEMAYVAGKNSDGDYRIYTWTDRRSQVQMYFLITARLKSSRQTIDEIMDSLRFD